MARILVTGAGGFLGSHVIPRFLEDGWGVTAMDVVSPDAASRLSPVMPKIEYRWQSAVDVTSKDMADVDLVLHLAAQADLPLAISSPKHTFQQNVDSFLNLVKVAAVAQVPVIMMSSESVYGAVPEDRLPAREDEVLRPSTPYAASKVANEALAYCYSKQENLPVRVLRSSTLFGEGMRSKTVVSIFARQAIDGRDITIEGDGSNTKDFYYVGNLVDAMATVAGKMVDGSMRGFDVYNVGGGSELSLLQLARKVVEVTGTSSKIVYRPWRAGEGGRLGISIEKAKREFGYEPKIPLDEGLTRLVAWMKG